MTTGSLGQGTSLAVGMALGDQLKGRSCRTFLLVGDGEADEGQVWEAAMFTAAKHVENVVWLVDWNKKQLGRLYQGHPRYLRSGGKIRRLWF